jgi:hypothetical protein
MVNIKLTDLEATELEYAIKYRLRSLDECDRTKDMIAILNEILNRLIATGFSLKS